MKNGITVHCIIKNEEHWIWYALKSVIPIAARIIIFDTGSTDNTVNIIKTFDNKKIIFQQKDFATPSGLTKLREEQLRMTNTPWFLILDGDEVWPSETTTELKVLLSDASEDSYGVVVRAWNLVGDIFHYHPESVKYHWPYAPKGYLGWANLRVIRTTIPGLKIKGDYPLEAYCDKTGAPIQNYGSKRLIFLKNRYFHMTYLARSTSRKIDKTVLNRAHKGKTEFGITFPKNFRYPEVFYQQRPSIVPIPWQRRSILQTYLSLMISPFKEARRRLLGLYNPQSRK